MNKKLVILGSGGHARVLFDILTQQSKEVSAIVSPEDNLENGMFNGIPHYTNDDYVIENFDSKEIKLVNGVGALPRQKLRTELFEKFRQKGFKFETVVDHRAIVSPHAEIKEGAQIMPGAIIQSGAQIGFNSIVNSGAIIEHDCVVGDFNHVAPGVTLSGGVRLAESVHVGSGATIIQGITVSKNAVVGAGAIVSKPVSASSIVYPARSTLENIEETKS
ncbi:MAG: acetyltransferase [Kangiellaceae bacterium]|nr:acetyltransferase [Kangiellaceae bacterium]MCW8999743.1 acetyltransferase [Kangiellaceae bacterium]MCW9016892.1 acetyltransferase [Kangiellaceae bacterium]